MNLALSTDSAPQADTTQTTPSILSANWLYLVCMLLIIFVGAFLQNASFKWGLLATELLLILLPTLVVVRLKHLPVTETLRLHWSGWASVGLGAVMGVGLYLVDVTLDTYMITVFGYTPPAAPDMYPTTIGQAVLMFVALAIAAPLCEEILFRGYIQRAYEGRGRRAAFIITSLLFVFFHLRLQGFVALLPIAFMLGYLRMHSNSLWPAVGAHFGNNASAAIVLSTAGLHPDWLANLPLGSPLLALVGLAVAVTALWIFKRLARRQDSIVTAPKSARFSLKAVLPLGIVALIFLVLGSIEVVYGRAPELLATGPLMLNEYPLQQEAQWVYEIRTVLNESVGEATCNLIPAEADYVLHCETVVQAFKVELPGSIYQAEDSSTEFMVRWQGNDLSLMGGEQQMLTDEAVNGWHLEPTAAGLNLIIDEADMTQTLALPQNVLLPDEWPWRLMALPFSMGLSQRANIAQPAFWQPEAETSIPIIEETAVIVSGAEPVVTRAGNFIAWRVNLGNRTAWYDVNAPHTLVQYDAGFAVYVLRAVR